MTAIDEYLASTTGWQQEMLLEWQRAIMELEPTAEQVIYYGVPCFKLDGSAIGGFAAYKNHCAYFPFSGETLRTLPAQLEGYTTTSGSLHVGKTQQLGNNLLKLLIETRKQEIAAGYGRGKKK